MTSIARTTSRALAALALAVVPLAATAQSSVTVAGSFQSAAGCSGDWQPACAATRLAYDPDDMIWQGTFNVPAGDWLYKAALDGSWNENYGANARRNGGNIALSLPAAAAVKFYYDDRTHWITSNRNAVIATVPGNIQSKLGCPGDWQPDCLRTWLEDPDGDGIYTFTTTALPAGSYEVKVVTGSDTSVKTVRVTSQLARVSPERLRGHFWERMFLSGEPALPGASPIESITVDYPERTIPLAFGYEMNWIWLFFILSMIAGFVFKELLGIEV